MVEHTVHHDSDSQLVRLFHKSGKVFIVTKPLVHSLIILGVIPMGGGLKQRSDIDCCCLNVRKVRQPFLQLREAVYNTFFSIHPGGARHPDRVHMVKYCLFIPFCHVSFPPFPALPDAAGPDKPCRNAIP